MFVDRWVDKENVVYLYNEILFSHEKEWNSALCSSSMNGSRDYHSKGSKSKKGKYHMLWLTCGI